MAFGDNQSDFDYTVSDASGKKGVKDGREYPISEEKWLSWQKEHKDSGCSDCSFVQDKKTLFIFLVPRELKEKATARPLFFGKFTMPGWSGHSGFYLFKCGSCNQVSVDYPHGYTSSGLIFLRCDHCQEKTPLEVKEERAIYEMEGIFIPKATRENRTRELRDMIDGVEEKGIRVIVPGFDDGTSAESSARDVWKVGLTLLAILTLGIFLLRILS